MSQQWNKFYHWRSHGCTPWAKTYFEQSLVGISIASPANTGDVKTTKLTSFEGDVELGNRKGKLVTIYDTSVTLEWQDTEGKTKGTIVFPEISHEVEDEGDEYQWQSTMTTSEAGADSHKVYEAVRKSLVPLLLPKLHAFRKELISAHASILGHDTLSSTGSSSSSSSTTDAKGTSTTTTTTEGKATATTTTGTPLKKTNTSTSNKTLTHSANLMINATDLWDFLTNPQKIPMWTKAPAQINLVPGAAFSLFGGNVIGSIISVEAPYELKQSWRLPTWPTNHFGELTTTLVEESGSTQLTLRLTGVPVGEEDVTDQGLEAYYLHSLKAMGLGTIL